MEKQIVSLSIDPHTVSLADRTCSLFIDSRTGSIFVDEGDGEGRMNGVVFSATNSPRFSVRRMGDARLKLILDYLGTAYSIGSSQDEAGLQRWSESANCASGVKSDSAGRKRTTHVCGRLWSTAAGGEAIVALCSVPQGSMVFPDLRQGAKRRTGRGRELSSMIAGETSPTPPCSPKT